MLEGIWKYLFINTVIKIFGDKTVKKTLFISITLLEISSFWQTLTIFKLFITFSTLSLQLQAGNFKLTRIEFALLYIGNAGILIKCFYCYWCWITTLRVPLFIKFGIRKSKTMFRMPFVSQIGIAFLFQSSLSFHIMRFFTKKDKLLFSIVGKELLYDIFTQM